jgi:hypothetical protein
MNKKWILIILVILLGLALWNKSESSTPLQQTGWEIIPEIFTKEEPEPSIPVISVDIITYAAVRSPNLSLGKVLADIDSHMPAGHPYSDEDKITWAHETTHGINNDIRNKHQGAKKYNASYVLDNKAILVEEPPTRMKKVVQIIPKSWQGNVWQLYMVSQADQWDDTPLYIGDEWTAYINGTICGKELGIGGIRYACTMEYSCEFIGYAIGLAYIIKQDCPNYNDQQFRAWFMYNTERLMNLYDKETGAKERLQILRTSPDGETLRQFARTYFGQAWCNKVLGI